jgi:hypothetical protein
MFPWMMLELDLHFSLGYLCLAIGYYAGDHGEHHAYYYRLQPKHRYRDGYGYFSLLSVFLVFKPYFSIILGTSSATLVDTVPAGCLPLYGHLVDLAT